MTENFKILAEFIKDISSETPNIESYIYVKENISKYQLNIDISSKPLKNKMVEISTTLKFEDKEYNDKKSYFEIVYASVVQVDEAVKDKKELEKIILCDVQNKIYPTLEKAFLNLLHNSGFPEIKLEKKINFTELYKQRAN
ncbi:MAG: protein-export chaperone SecB [Candidatus Pelagibacter bacterium]|jgi:preprotein translocase subunit SecB|nr:protein-export chaperone SecB [Candidatus Pelagibacter sp.]MDC1248405.1 protein-export chaperone SecB [Pelagibacteraceae bacterium]MDF1857414.1 protein-export chaperone SecB [Candidatus Pelagibacter bacterium]